MEKNGFVAGLYRTQNAMMVVTFQLLKKWNCAKIVKYFPM